MKFISIVLYISIYLGLVATTFYFLSFMHGKRQEKELYLDSELPKVTVLIPAFNEEHSIEPTLNSILASDYPKDRLEVIVIDDGSTDHTYEIAKRFISKNVKVFTKKNGGKGTALNFAIGKSSGEIVFSMDADTFVEPDSLKKMVRYFKNEKVMCVTPAITLYKPKGILQGIQAIEYLTGIFLRKTFSYLNAVHITPGAFSAYRKTFFEKYGGYDENNLTEDLELALRIQINGGLIENAEDAAVYTLAPKTFSTLLKQRRRWYIGLMKNTWKYRRIFGPKYGDLGTFIFPMAWISIVLTISVTIYSVFRIINNFRRELIFLNSINYDFRSTMDFSLYAFERMFFLTVTNPILLFVAFFTVVAALYLRYASKKVNVKGGIFSLMLFFIAFAMLFGFWWICSIAYALFSKKISWR